MKVQYCRGPENDVHTRAARLRLNLFSKDIGAFLALSIGGFSSLRHTDKLPHWRISETYIRHILRMNIFNDYTILHSTSIK